MRKAAFEAFKELPIKYEGAWPHIPDLVELAHDDAKWVVDNLLGLPQHALTPHADEMVRIAQENADWIVRSVALKVLYGNQRQDADLEHALVPYAEAIAGIAQRDSEW